MLKNFDFAGCSTNVFCDLNVGQVYIYLLKYSLGGGAEVGAGIGAGVGARVKAVEGVGVGVSQTIMQLLFEIWIIRGLKCPSNSR